MENVLFLLIGILIGFIFSRIFKKKELSTSGYLRYDQSDPDSPYMFLEIKNEEEFYKIPKKKKVCFDVKTEDFIPQK